MLICARIYADWEIFVLSDLESKGYIFSTVINFQMWEDNGVHRYNKNDFKTIKSFGL